MTDVIDATVMKTKKISKTKKTPTFTEYAVWVGDESGWTFEAGDPKLRGAQSVAAGYQEAGYPVRIVKTHIPAATITTKEE